MPHRHGRLPTRVAAGLWAAASLSTASTGGVEVVGLGVVVGRGGHHDELRPRVCVGRLRRERRSGPTRPRRGRSRSRCRGSGCGPPSAPLFDPGCVDVERDHRVSTRQQDGDRRIRLPGPDDGDPGLTSSMSGVRLASVPGTPRSWARLSAMASRRLMRPATASLVMGGWAGWPSSSRRLACAGAENAGLAQVVGDLLSEDLHRAVNPRPCGDRGPGRTAQVGVVEVGEPVGRGAHLPPHPAFLHASTASWAPSRVSIAPMASPSRMTTRSTPRTSRALAWMPRRRAAPTRARAASGPGR